MLVDRCPYISFGRSKRTPVSVVLNETFKT